MRIMQIGPSGRISDKNVLGLNSIELYIFIEIQMLKKKPPKYTQIPGKFSLCKCDRWII